MFFFFWQKYELYLNVDRDSTTEWSWTEQKMNGAGDERAETVRCDKINALRYTRYVIFKVHVDWTLELSILFVTHKCFSPVKDLVCEIVCFPYRLYVC